jgi:hypothetical protein
MGAPDLPQKLLPGFESGRRGLPFYPAFSCGRMRSLVVREAGVYRGVRVYFCSTPGALDALRVRHGDLAARLPDPDAPSLGAEDRGELLAAMEIGAPHRCTPGS